MQPVKQPLQQVGHLQGNPETHTAINLLTLLGGGVCEVWFYFIVIVGGWLTVDFYCIIRAKSSVSGRCHPESGPGRGHKILL